MAQKILGFFDKMNNAYFTIKKTRLIEFDIKNRSPTLILNRQKRLDYTGFKFSFKKRHFPVFIPRH